MSEFIVFPSETMEERLRKKREMLSFLSNLPKADTLEDLRKMEDSSSKLNKEIIFLSKFFSLNDFLKGKFEMNLNDFFGEYTLLYLKEKLPLLQASEDVVCLFEDQNAYDENASLEMKAKLAHFRGENPESPINKIYDGPLHNSNISYFVLRRVHFEIKRKNMPINGFVFSNGKFNFWISSSSQCDLTVVYEEKDKEP